ncbi:MFS transporter [Methylopila sp. 73B]|uniref:MFS transporter n=1 Tax=Methylopila sp. 73B TaxID=1120792 RepID=UPI0009DFD968
MTEATISSGGKASPAGKTARLVRIQWIAVAFLTVAGVINYLDRSSLSIANTAIREEMGLTPTEMGLLLSAFSLSYAFAQLPIGALLDRFGSASCWGPACSSGRWRRSCAASSAASTSSSSPAPSSASARRRSSRRARRW